MGEEPQGFELGRYLEAQRRLAAELIAGSSLDEVAPSFLWAVATLLGWEAAALWSVSDDAQALRFVAGWSAPELDAEPLWEASRQEAFGTGVGLPGQAWENGSLVWAPQFSDDRAYPRRAVSAALGLRAALAIPVPIGPPEDVLAVVELHTSSQVEPSEESIGLLTGFADQLRAFIVRRRAERAGESAGDFKSAVLASSLDCIVGMDHEGRIVEFNEAAERLFEHSREEALGQELAELLVPPDLRERHRAGLRRYVETGEGTLIGGRVEFPALRADGSIVLVELTITRLRGSDPPVFTGFLRDLSDRVDAERVRHHLSEVVKGTRDAVLSKDLKGILTSWNPAAERVYGYSAEEAIGRHISFLIPEDHKNEEQVILDRVRNGENLDTYETERIRADGARIAVSLTVSPIRSPLRGLIGASVVARDITAEKRRREAQAFLVSASRQLESSLDPSRTARTIVETAVPDLAEICLIDFVRADGSFGNTVAAGADPEAAARLEEVRKSAPLDPDGEHPVAQVLREGRPMIWRDLKAPGVIDQVAQSDEHRRLMGEAGYVSAAVVPLLARGRTIGALSFLHARQDRRYDDADLELLGELGDRAAMALDNARLYQERDKIAGTLQRGLRPPQPASVPGLEISVVFEAAGEGIEIGGDLYDVLPTADGCWVLIGDVAGKGSAAAGVSVSVRHAVRGLTRVIDDPAEVLRQVNEMLLAGGSLNDFATVQLMRLRQGPGGAWAMSLASAGHPPAVHADSSGAVQLGGGAVLGAWADSEIGRHEVEVRPGDTLVLCTDGWLEVGPVDAHRGPDDLAELVSSGVELGLDDLTERLRADALGRGEGVLRDDMVVLAVRSARSPSAAS